MPFIEVTNFDDQLYDQIFCPEFFSELAALMDLELCSISLQNLRLGHSQSYSAYNNAEFVLKNYKTEKEENRKLAQVVKDADRLYETLISLIEFGQTQEKISRNIIDNHTAYKDPAGRKLSDFINPDPYRSLFTLREFLSDLSISAERSINKMPAKVDAPGFYHFDDELEEQDGDMFTPIDVTGTTEYRANFKRWQDRSQSHRLPRDFALQKFIKAFKPTWLSLTAQPFSEGHYYGEARQTVSNLVDAIELSLKQHNAPFTRQNIVTAIRKINTGKLSS